MSSIVPIPKSKSGLDNLANYRPISLLPIVSKLLEKHIYSMVLKHLFEKKILSDDQWGFSSGKSTVTALLSSINDILQLLESGADVSMIFFDLCKAFDSVPHLPLLHKLRECDLDQYLLQWITNYLCGREQYVVVNGVFSTTVPVVSGVPQGSVLGPLLFLVYINCVSTLQLSPGTKLAIYADDILLYKPISSPEDYCHLQQDIHDISNCIEAHYLTLNTSKCKYLIASKKRQPCLPPGGLILGECMLEQVHSYRYLGIMVTSTLSWRDHIQQICNKARKLIGILYRNFSAWADTHTLRCLYLVCIRPHLEYACQLWDPYLTGDINMLESVQKFACRVCLKRWDLDYYNMLLLLDIPPLSTRRKYLKLTVMYNIVKNNYHFPPDIFVRQHFPYRSRQEANAIFFRPFARTQYLYYSFIPSVIMLWNSLPLSIKHSSSISSFKRSLLYHLSKAHV